MVNFGRMKNSMKALFGGAFCLATIALLTLPTGCSTDVDVIAEYEDITIVYGLLDARDSLHYVKVNKAFLGEDDAVIMAEVRDSSEYTNLQVRIEEVNGNGNTVRNWSLTDTSLVRDDSGFSEEQTYYYFKEKTLSADFVYRLTVVVNPESGSEKVVTAETPLIGDMIISRPPPNLQVRLVNGQELSEQTFKWNAAANGLLYDIDIEIPIDEKRGDDITSKTLGWKVASLRASSVDGGEELEFQLSGEEFYNQVAAGLDENDASVDGRKIPDGEIIIWITAGGEELATYSEVANPSSGLIQDKPEYTNVTNGLGVFSCRIRQDFRRTLDKATLDELMDGVVGSPTGPYGFCNPNIPNTDPDACDW